ncbi:hypothetical protein B0H21DRAFT_582693 [Amylocystis lapponica]|nr:hypothetical protein B0H21DRAFT_582693 [Amylocystis lapponica]
MPDQVGSHVNSGLYIGIWPSPTNSADSHTLASGFTLIAVSDRDLSSSTRVTRASTYFARENREMVSFPLDTTFPHPFSGNPLCFLYLGRVGMANVPAVQRILEQASTTNANGHDLDWVLGVIDQLSHRGFVVIQSAAELKIELQAISSGLQSELEHGDYHRGRYWSLQNCGYR